MQQKFTTWFIDLITIVHEQYQSSWLLRWILIQIPAWGLAFALAILPVSIIGIPGLLLPGIIAGLVVGFLQRMALRTHPDLALIEDNNVLQSGWLLWSSAGGCAATLFVYIAAIVLIINIHIGLLLMGAIFGVFLHGMQAYALRDIFPDSMIVWIFAGLIGGGACAVLTGFTLTANLPIFCSPGAIVFGGITGYTLRYLIQDEKNGVYLEMGADRK